MITNDDMRYHHDAMLAATDEATRYLWSETVYVPFAVPEERLFGAAYVLARPGLGVALSEIRVFHGLGRTRFDAEYSDNQQQLPAPAAFEHFTLVNGLSLDLRDGPERYTVDYAGIDDTRFSLVAEAIMPAFDIHDPAMDPNARTSAEDQAAHSSYGKAYNGHYDQLCQITGSLSLRGKEYAIDYVDCMDRSWGPRAEIDCPPMAWMHAVFGKDYAFHAIWSLNLSGPADGQYTLAHGFVLEDGVVHGATAAAMTADRDGVWGAHYDLSVTDVRGRQHRFQGAPIASGLWECYGCVGVPNVLNRWTADDGRIGYGDVQEAWFYDNYLRLRAASRTVAA